MRSFSFVTLLLLPAFVSAQPPMPAARVLLMGDSIRLGYAPLVTKKLDGVAVVFSFPDNGGDTNTTLKQLDEWLKDGKGPFAPLWFGRTLWGMFVRDDQVALDYLCTRPEVEVKKIGATGMSMGSTHSWWLAAVDDRIACVVGVACLTRYENLLKHGQLRQHGTYYFVNGILKHFDTEAVVSLIAPRPVLFLTGELDAGSPADGIRVIEAKAGSVYKTLGAEEKFKSIRYPEVGHTYTQEMRKEMLAWFEKWLK